jgi:hypothetical protein
MVMQAVMMRDEGHRGRPIAERGEESESDPDFKKMALVLEAQAPV